LRHLHKDSHTCHCSMVKKFKKQKSHEIENLEYDEISSDEIQYMPQDICSDDISYDYISTKNGLGVGSTKSYTDLFLSVIIDFSRVCFNFAYKTVLFSVKVSGVYFLWIFLHYVSSHLYVKFCVSNTMLGFFMSPFMTVAPHCQGLRWIIHTAANVINNMWIVLGTWLASTIFSIHKDSAHDV